MRLPEDKESQHPLMDGMVVDAMMRTVSSRQDAKLPLRRRILTIANRRRFMLTLEMASTINESLIVSGLLRLLQRTYLGPLVIASRDG